MKKYRALCFLDSDHGRDVEILMPLVYYAEKYLNCQVEFELTWNRHSIYIKQPDIILIANTIGSHFHFQIAQYAHQQGIKIFSLISEGNFRTNGTFNYWGYNTDKQFYEDYICHWSKRTRDFLIEAEPRFSHKNVLTGATGFDRYKIYNFPSRQEFFKEKGLKNYKRVIGYAGWAFGKAHNAQGRMELAFYFNNAPNHLDFVEEQRKGVESVLRQAIENNPDTLFILKKHPSEENPTITVEGPNEMNGLMHYPNVLYVREKLDIHTLIHISDLWMGFESTTVLESWVLRDNPTIFINPEVDFSRDKIFNGTHIVRNYQELQSSIDEFYESGTINDFNTLEKKQWRQQLIEETIGFADGLNHVRAGTYLAKVLAKISPGYAKKPSFTLHYFIMFWMLKMARFVYNEKLFLKIPIAKKHVWLFKIYGLHKVKALQKEYYNYLNAFHDKNNLAEKINNQAFIEKLFEE